ncbi:MULTISPECIES: hypothetical protein [unclassified Brevundimonas]|uniref:hypothetical protein n=1 Tax=unclassified Brevundimonas TaxID=2622653 RepID=UPI0025BD617F|nr:MULTISPECIES: hypothetical protein [unclassified Brevundimonas]
MKARHDTTPAGRAYAAGTLISMGIYALGILAASFAVEYDLARPVIIALALVPGLAILAHIVAILNYLRSADEFLKALTARRLIIASMGTLAIFAVWGFLETFAGLQGPAGWAAYCVMWGLFGIVSVVERFTQ